MIVLLNVCILKHEDEPAQNEVIKGQEISRSAAKNKKKREAKVKAKQETVL